jgi:hypothetical protein
MGSGLAIEQFFSASLLEMRARSLQGHAAKALQATTVNPYLEALEFMGVIWNNEK